MIVTRDEILSAMATVEDFKIIKNHEKTDGAILASWKGSVFYMTFNNELIEKIDNNNDDDVIFKAVSADFTITFAITLGKIENISTIDKYKIVNYANMKSNLGAVYVFREDADMIEIPVRHSVYLRENGSSLLAGGVMRMVLIGVVAVNDLKKVIEKYNENVELFLKECRGVK
ncbi:MULTISPECIES: hypothetical protein [Pectobacterium]|uniref:Uncharacterized protein n=1 Tax=Pectobacterium carotovorum subsp. carotovorum (strain PC1) TaxID=561230 RepID=C6DC97_PECCP|nr:hypothetical protein [Pectobacterium carotovorum]ACT14191.1 hypothetical protein PC1_3168 [Pectobacterium carotovorum subsp. carotovorum PC1]